jgi:hypothetical protein
LISFTKLKAISYVSSSWVSSVNSKSILETERLRPLGPRRRSRR